MSSLDYPLMRIPILLALLILLPVSAFAGNNGASALVVTECNSIGRKLGSVSVRECLHENMKDSGAYSVKGQPILIKDYPPLHNRTPQARILLIGGIHGDEYSSVSVVFKWMKTLDRYHSGLFHWHIIPLANPDGLLQKHSQRLNAHGVDLNRNFPTPDWYHETRDYWQRRTGKDPRRYPGTDPLSEPESRWLYEEIRRFKPQAIISVHAPYGVLDFDGPPRSPDKLGYLYLKLIGTYPGSLGNCAGVQHHIPVITVELPRAGTMPSGRNISRMWRDLVRWLKRNIPKDKTIQSYALFDEISRQMQTDYNTLP